MDAVEIYDASNIEGLKWPDSEEGELAKSYLYPLIKEGTERYIANAKTDLYLLKIDDFIIPVSVNDREYENSYLLSTYFVVANLKEKLEKASGWVKLWSKPLVNLFSKMMKWIKINKVVIINNWLMSTNIYPELSEEQIKTLTTFLKGRFPDHYFMFRSVNTYRSSTVFDGLNLENYRMIPSRQVYLYDPGRTDQVSHSNLRKQKKDFNKIARSNYEVESVETLTEEEIARLLELYRGVYITKYTKYSPLYTEQYLRDAIKNKAINFKLLKKDDVIYGVSGFVKKNGYILTTFFGYDTTLPLEEGLYRMLSAVIMQEIKKEKLISHQGSGASDFKKWRGCQEAQEYIAIYDHHLPLFRRLFWFLGEKFSSKFQH